MDSLRQILNNIKKMCQNPSVREALMHHTMDQIGLSVKLYLFMMKHGWYVPCYMVTKVFFALYYRTFWKKG